MTVEEFPTTWEKSSLGELIEIVMGQAPPGNDCNKNGNGTVFVKAGEFNELRPFVREWTTNPLRMARDTDVLLCVVGATCGKLNLGINCAIGRSVAALRPFPALEQKYLYYFLLTRVLHLRGGSTGSAQGVISKDDISAIEIPLSPVNEQRRVIAKIEELFSELDKGIEALTTASRQLTAYRQSVLKHAFEGKLTEEWRKANPHSSHGNLLAHIQCECKARTGKAFHFQPERHDPSFDPQVPEGWAAGYIGNLNVDIFDGPFGSNLKTSDYVESGIRVIRLENIGRGNFIDEKQSFVSEKKYASIQKHTVVPGDIVFSSFVTDAIRSTLVPSHVPFAVNKADCFGVRLFGQTVNPKFVQFFFQSRNALKQVKCMIHGVGRPRINTTQLKELVVPVCGPVEQAIIVEKLESIFSRTDAFEATLEGGLAHLTALRQSILKKAFSGQLVPQDATDESASALQARIRAEREKSEPKRKRNGKNGKKNAA